MGHQPYMCQFLNPNNILIMLWPKMTIVGIVNFNILQIVTVYVYFLSDFIVVKTNELTVTINFKYFKFLMKSLFNQESITNKFGNRPWYS